jgi:hypothetical protein
MEGRNITGEEIPFGGNFQKLVLKIDFITYFL